MMSHIQKQANANNKIYLENSPERKSHDNMLLNPKNKLTGSFLMMDGNNKHAVNKIYNDEANVVDKINSQ